MKLDKSKNDETKVDCNNTNNGLIHKTGSEGDTCFIMSESEKRENIRRRCFITGWFK